MNDDMYPVYEKHSLVLRFVHWANVPLLSLMIWSGWLIYWANPAYVTIPDNIGFLEIHHRLAEGMGWHFFIMWPFLLNGLVYIGWMIFSGNWRTLFPDKKTWKAAFPYLLYDLKLKKESPAWDETFNPVQKIAYTGAIFLALGSVTTGIAIYKPVQLHGLLSILGGYEAARLEHFLCMVAFLLFIAVHILQVIRAGWNNFRAMVSGYEIEEN
jgi:thiosulfate reductase cytochrome b subunit